MYMAEKDTGEKQMFRLTPLLCFLPYYLISNSVPYLITHQVLPRNYGYVIRFKVKIYRNFFVLLIYLYQILHISVKENLEKFFFSTKIRSLHIQKFAHKGVLTASEARFKPIFLVSSQCR
ncbi:MAG: hypothetical protein A2Z38_12620 [Planctomycetes bacterium RBG_19FT_COMBO_48_8]|nr:MAG: hypothetical protein A2Z38_12620 [Planctomycetes bacterium RBG_19FT_COMBO_48_8]